MNKPVLFLLLMGCFSCQAQTLSADKVVGGSCEGCEAIFEYGDEKLNAIDTLPLFLENEPKLKITGIVFQNDGKTPASDVILYIYHTDRTGIYPKVGDEKGWAKRHGFIRGWTITDQAGQYTFYTFRPASYPDRTEPEHIHLTVKELGKSAYYLDEYVFEDDPILTSEKRTILTNRGGSGIVKPKLENGIWLIERDLILGFNIPDYE
ncbi:protocatechuate 3,4-dioxygenase beta subunit [Algoriphagus ratkowskyi]|uniref:Intradiol ring-cleavage dioxygenase n=1 Tax=Algoriphagus ratkowskyi TaxID=57028 RepID=A0A2W7RDV7_9BACT|nr:intradiol ring-cleavage dioxygenase [Algoriphagus ratkowskyi]PZX58311.1 protocatechuate 3,4-dioxygenase beta subunit [Algoriphagus ratkowskyi]TXD77814.1 intradiol ring-cleavage dioxygenase [Algoriphagus ratkowskyi]